MQSTGFLLIFLAIVVLILRASCEDQDEPTNVRYTDAHRALHRLVGQTTHSHLQGFEIVLLDVSNTVLSHYGKRQKRDLLHSDDQKSFRFTSHGEDFHVELTPNNRLVARDFSVDRIRKGITFAEDLTTDGMISNNFNCHHIGQILSHQNRTAAVSTCGGLTGLLRTEEDDYFIEPIPSHIPHDFPDYEQPHIVYKRRNMFKDNDRVNICGKPRRNPIPTSIDNFEVKELSNGEMIVVREHGRSRPIRPSNHTHRRPKRGDPKRDQDRRRVVETLVVVDRHLIGKHLWEIPDVTAYVLTVMNMASALYRDSSLDEKIDIVLVGLVFLEDDEELQLDHRADKSLTNFCRWQAKINTTSGRKADHSILITGMDICIDKNEPCDTLGLAQIGGMCSTTESCTINEDNGLGLAFTIAHETGHSFGMKHDGRDNSCGKRQGHIMSSTLSTLNGVFTWSACSRRSIATFLESDRSRCLDNEPTFANVSLPNGLPGRRYNATIQCQLQYGPTSDLCVDNYLLDLEPICKTLFCRVDVNGLCKTKHMPAAEGTTCGKGKWCRRGVCVRQGSPGPKPVDGGWSRYGPWSDCSRTCGRGVSFRQRFCNNPYPMYGGRYCEGEEKIYNICNNFKCPPDTDTYRAQQCARYNSQPYRRQYFTWIPFTKYWKYDFNQCELFCEAEGYGFFDRLASRVVDGTSCNDESNDICIEGQCVHVGCDMLINSNATVDACGVCNGDNSTCRFITGSFRRRVRDSGYYRLVKIPKGARTIRIWEERCCTHTYIAAKSAVNSSRYFLNGNWRVNLYGDWKFGGAKWRYERENLKGEQLFTDGPLKEDIVIEVLIVRKNPGVSYTYAVQEIENALPHDSLYITPKHKYAWNETFSSCSQTCGGGEQRSISECVEDGKHRVNDSYCVGIDRPEDVIRRCNTRLCPTRWEAGEWKDCSRTCGGGVQVRRVTCIRDTLNGTDNVPPKHCKSIQKPSKNRICARNDCPPAWKATRWSKCSRTCGRGIRSRRVYCKSGIKRLLDERCDLKSKPASRQICVAVYCHSRFKWIMGEWDECSVTCGQGRQYRTMKCVYNDNSGRSRVAHYRRCRGSRKPKAPTHKTCNMPACRMETTEDNNTDTRNVKKIAKVVPKKPAVSRRVEGHIHSGDEAGWVSGDWQSCTAPCGGGHQVRAVKCMHRGKPSVACSYGEKLSNIRTCNTHNCSGDRTTTETCIDKHYWCHMVPQHNTCSHIYFGKQCCKSCKAARGSGPG